MTRVALEPDVWTDNFREFWRDTRSAHVAPIASARFRSDYLDFKGLQAVSDSPVATQSFPPTSYSPWVAIWAMGHANDVAGEMNREQTRRASISIARTEGS